MSTINKLGIVLSIMNQTLGKESYGQQVFHEEEVTDCLLKMYFYMMEPNEERFKEFEELYDQLTIEQQEQVKEDYVSILDQQKKNKEKTKKNEKTPFSDIMK